MGAFDISRNAFNPAKHFTSVRMQQGRVMTDDDWNENERIENEDRRRLLTDVVGPFGSPDKGFKIQNLSWSGATADFTIEPGVLYLGGLRLEMDYLPSAAPSNRETYRLQRDWLNKPPLDFAAPSILNFIGPRYDLVYVEAWQQGVSAVEDHELFEPALAGPDTSTRMRNMRRVHVLQDVGAADCTAAFAAACAQWQAAGLGKINDEFERIVDTTLTVGFTAEGTGGDLCTPLVGGGYLGAENQAIRVQLVDATHYTWGFDNSSPYYRVKAIDAHTVELLDLPKDQHHWMLGGTVVEFLEWSAVLPSGEKVAEILGHLAKVQGSYNPQTHQLTFSPNIDLLQFNQNYEARADQAFLDQAGADTHFYMRVWDRGSDTISDASVLIQVGANVLGDTGLELRFTGNDRVPGDFWIIAARPETPQEVLPWRLRTNGMKPFGHRRYFAPLAVVKWTLPFASENIIGEIIHDCRKTFRPLTDLETCCTFHVGDGKHSFGDFNSLAEALANLPDAGGKICMLPGRHYANVEIAYKSHITICGCGDQSILFTEEGRAADPTITIRHSDNITIEGLSFVARRNRAIYLSDMEAELDIASNTIIIRRNYFVAGGTAIYIHTQSDVAGDNNIYIGYNEIAIPNVDTAGVGIFCLADGVLIEHNRVLVVPDPQDDMLAEEDDNGDPVPEPNPCDQTSQEEEDLDIVYFWTIWDLIHNLFGWDYVNPYLALGGIQIGGSSERVRLIENTIVGGASNGITLGHMPSDLDTIGLALVPHPRWEEFHRTAMTTGDFDLGTLVLGELGPLLGHFKPALYGITIERNEIRDMGLAGVGTICFFQQTTVLQDIVVIVNDLQLRDNKIVHCAQQIPSITRNSMFVGYGGVVMAVLERGAILDNLIQDCGKRSAEPICGIYIMSGDKLEISRNRILNNGPSENLGLAPGSFNPYPTRLGTRGGIFIASLTKADILDVFLSEGIRNGLPAAKIQDNIVVQPLGQALFLIALGPVSVLGNNFTTQDQDITNELSINAATVYILNLGVSNDQMRVNFEPTLSQLSHLPSGMLTANNPVYTVGLILEGFLYLPSGQVMFNNNQVTFDQRNVEIDSTLSSVSIITSDDISFCANQLECLGLGTLIDAELGIVLTADFVVTDALLVGMTVRTADNRFQEGFTGTTWSLVSAAYANTTTGNQSSKCLNAFGTRDYFANNIESLLDDDECQRNRGLLGRSTGLLYGS